MMTTVLKLIGILLILVTLVFYIFGVNAVYILGWRLLILGLGLYFLLRSPWIVLKSFQRPTKRNLFIYFGWFVFFFALVFFFQFWHFKEFGLYEADYFRVVPTFSWNWSDLWNYLSYQLYSALTIDSVGNILTSVFSFVGYQIGGLQSIYLISMFVPAVICFLFFMIFKKLFGHDLAGLFAALLFIFYPSYRTPQFLFLTFSKQIGLLLMLCSLYAFLHQRKLLFELLMFATMILVKAYAPIFLLFPLFQINVSRKDCWQVWLDHLKTTALPLLFIISALSLQMGLWKVLYRVGYALLIPVRFYRAFSEASFGNGFMNFAVSPISLFYNYSLILVLVFIVSWILFAGLFVYKRPTKKVSEANYKIKNSLLSADIKLLAAPGLLDVLKLFLVSPVVLIFSFAGFDDTVLTNVYFNNLSVSYLVSALPMILLFSSLFMALIVIPRKVSIRLILIVLIAAFLSLLGVDRFFLQRKLIQSWRADQWFWTNVLVQTEAVSEDTMFIIQYHLNQDLQSIRFLNYYIKHEYNLLPFLIEKDPDWSYFPRVDVEFDAYVTPSQEMAKSPQCVLEYSILISEFQAERTCFDTYEGSAVQIPVSELDKKPLYDLMFVDDYIGVSLDLILQKGLINEQ